MPVRQVLAAQAVQPLHLTALFLLLLLVRKLIEHFTGLRPIGSLASVER